MAASKKLVFALSAKDAEALIEVAQVFDRLGYAKRGSMGEAIDRAANHLDEQLALQQAKWERCPKCAGSGWVEEGT